MTPTTHMQQDPGWEIQTGPDIAPNDAKITITQRPLWVPTGLLIDIVGQPGKYSGAVARSADYPIPPGSSSAVLTAVFALDSLADVESIELGIKLATPKLGITLNNQFQYSLGAPSTQTLDLTSIKGSGWSPTPFVRTKFAPNVEHAVIAGFKWNEGIKPDGSDSFTSVMSVETDGEQFVTPPNMLHIPGKALGWKPGYFQFNCQPNVNQNGGRYQVMLYDVSVQFS